MGLLPSHRQMSEAIGTIYDAAIDPGVWPRALEQMCMTINACFGSISIVDPHGSEVRFVSRWGGDPLWLAKLDAQYAVMMPFLPVLDRFDVGQPFSMPMAAEYLGDPDVWSSEFVTEWATPAGIRDSASVVLQRSINRFAAMALCTGMQRDPVSSAELEVIGLFAPHVRRALTISDLIDMKNLAADTFERMLDALQVAVIAVDDRSRVRHANQIAGGMLSAGSPLAVRQGRIVVPASLQATSVLHEAVSRAGNDSSSLPGSGMGIPLRFADGRPAIGHVLPLRQGSSRRVEVPGAAAAIFIATPTDAHHAPIAALSGLYGLTEAESRVLDQIASGKNRGQAAASLSVADSTVKTHLERIFSKTGTSTQHDLVRLITSLSAPITSA